MGLLARNPKVVQLAKDLGLDWRGDCVAAIRRYALEQIERIIHESPIAVDSLATLQWLVADKFRVRIEVIVDESDIARIAAKYSDFDPLLRQRLAHEFTERSTEGITLERHEPDPRVFRYLAVVDARGDRFPRVYFTSWHELAHFLVYPSQLAFPGFRRTPASEEWAKDPVESVVDHVAGKSAFYAVLFQPALENAMANHGGLTFAAVDAAREVAAPTASLFASAIAAVSLVERPALFVVAEMALKAEEERFARSSQQTFAFATAEIREKLRLSALVGNDAAATSTLAIRRKMRVPPDCVLTLAQQSVTDVTLSGLEDQASWETSRHGTLASVPLRVEAARRGRHVYGLISTLA
jgi:hypothetical protein